MTDTILTRLYLGTRPYIQVREEYHTACTRCEGTGQHLFDGLSSACYRCGGARVDPNGSVYSREEAEARSARLDREADRRASARQAAIDAKIAERLAYIDTVREEHPGLIEFLETYPGRSPFVCAMREMVSDVTSTRLFTDRMIEGIKGAMKDAAVLAVIELAPGRQTIEGIVNRAVYKDTDFGYVLKITVVLDNGARVYGTAPKALLCELEALAENGLGEGPALRVRFDAAVTPSISDPSFGFYSRPTKAALVE